MSPPFASHVSIDCCVHVLLPYALLYGLVLLCFPYSVFAMAPISPVGSSLSFVSSEFLLLVLLWSISCFRSTIHPRGVLSIAVSLFCGEWSCSSRIWKPKFKKRHWIGLRETHQLELGVYLVYQLLAPLLSWALFFTLTWSQVTCSLVVLCPSWWLQILLLGPSFPKMYPSVLLVPGFG